MSEKYYILFILNEYIVYNILVALLYLPLTKI